MLFRSTLQNYISTLTNEKNRITNQVNSQCTQTKIPADPASGSKIEKLTSDAEYNSASALLENLKTRFRIEQGDQVCASTINFIPISFDSFRIPYLSKDFNKDEHEGYLDWVKYVYEEYNKAIALLVSKCGLSGKITSPKDANNADKKDSTTSTETTTATQSSENSNQA